MQAFAHRAVLLLLPMVSSLPVHAAEDERLVFGELRVGMSLDAARAALPNVQWTVLEEHRETHRAYRIQGDDAVTIAGIAFDVKIGNRYTGVKSWGLETVETVTKAANCQSRAMPVAEELERRFGSFHPLGQVIDGEALLKFGKVSQAKISAAEGFRGIEPNRALEKNPQQYWFIARHDMGDDDDLQVHLRAHYQRDEGHACEIRIEMDGHEPPPRELNVVFDPARLIARPTIAYRSSSLRALGAPKQKLSFVVPCRLAAATGDVGSCVDGPTGAAIDPYRKLATQWALRYQLQLNGAQADDARYFDIDVPITMAPEDVRTVDVTTGPLLDPKQIEVTSRMKRDPDDKYNAELSSLKADVPIRLYCKVQEDGSVLCDLAPGTTSPSQGLKDAAIDMLEWLEIKPTLRNGASAAGGLIEQRITFRPPPK